MWKNRIKLIKAFLVITILLTGFVHGGYTVAAASWSSDYRKWSQGASDYSAVNEVGCWIVAMAKMIYESGIDRSSTFNPDRFAEWEVNNGLIPNLTNNLNQLDGANAPVIYARQRGITLTYLNDSRNVTDEQLWTNIHSNYYTILKVSNAKTSSHYVLIDNFKSRATGYIYVYDSVMNQSQADSQPITIYTRLASWPYRMDTVIPDVNTPEACLDYIGSNEPGKVTVRGWAFDKDCPDTPITVQVRANNKIIGNARANLYRPDVRTAYGVGEYHGFEIEVSTDYAGEVSITVWALNSDIYGKLTGQNDLFFAHEFINIEAAPVTNVSLDKTALTLYKGESETLTATVLPDYAHNKTVTWKSSDVNVATVQNGKVTAINSGTATITVTTADGNKTAQCSVIVKTKSNHLPQGRNDECVLTEPRVVRISGYAYDKDSPEANLQMKIYMGEQGNQLLYNCLADNEYQDSYEDTGDESIVGKKHGYELVIETELSGIQPIKVFASDIDDSGNSIDEIMIGEYTLDITPVVAVKEVYLTKSELKMILGNSVQFIYYIEPDNATNQKVSWSSNNPAVASVTSKGVVTAVSEGTAIITVTTEDGNKTASCTVTVTSAQQEENASVSYSALVQDSGWQTEVKDGETAGTVGQSKKLEAIKIKVTGTSYTGNVEYKTHVQKYGWESEWRKNFELSGSEEGLRLEAMQIRLTGELAEHYDIYYRLHVQKFGWLDWAKNGENSGSSGFSYRVEGIEIRLVEKNGAAPGNTDKIFHDATAEKFTQVNYQTQVQRYGWLETVSNGEMSGTQQQSLRVEGIKMWLSPKGYDGSIEYRTLIQSKGWEETWAKDGSLSGTAQQSLRLEAIQIRLTGELADQYDIYYRVQAQRYGWLGWAKNGENAGSGEGLRLEAIEIRLVEKGGPAPGSTTNPYIG